MGLKVNSLFQGNMIVKGAIALAAFGLTYYALKDQEKDTAQALTATTTDYTTVDGFKNKLLEKIYNGAMNPTVLIQNIEAVKTEVNSYTAQITTLIAERVAGRIPQSTLEYYAKAIAEEIATKLKIELRPSGWGGGYGGYDGGGGYGWPSQGGGWYDDDYDYDWSKKYKKSPWKRGGYGYGGGGGYGQYSENYDDYLDTLMQYYQQLMSGGYYQPNYGYSMGYGYQQPNLQPYMPNQNYNYYPQYPGSYNTPNQGFAYMPGQTYQPGVYY